MTDDYFAIQSDGPDQFALSPSAASELGRRGCVQRVDHFPLLLFTSADLPLRTAASKGWIFGPLFDRAGSSANLELDLDLTHDGLQSLLHNFWGNYIAITAGKEGWSVFRDPSGGRPCYFAKHSGRHYFTSRPTLLIECGIISPTLNWTEVAHSLADHASRREQTAVRGIEELLPGTVLARNSRVSRLTQVWQAPSGGQANSPAQSIAELEQALSSTLAAWGRSLRRPLIEISGGLDSAIVAAGMSRASPDPRLITFAAAPGDPDELTYARALSSHLGLDLEIVRPHHESVDLERSLAASLPRPNARAFTQAADALSLRHGQAIGADAFVSGGGGDDVFCYLRTILPAIDRLIAKGSFGMLATAADIAVMNHSTMWEAMQRIARRLFRRSPRTAKLDLRFLNRDAIVSIASIEDHQPFGRLPGKAEHVRNVLSIHNYLEGHARAEFAPILSPLLSQPIVECCLTIPTWHWCQGGRNRAVARAAFRDRLPQILLERRSKGHFDGFCAALLDHNRDLVVAMLLEGHLAKNGLLDSDAVAAALQNPFPSAETVTRLLALVDTEAWAAGWAARPPQRG